MIRAKLVQVFVAGLLLVGSAALVAPSPALAADKPTVSKNLAKPLKAAQDAMKAKRWQDAVARLKEAEGTAGKSQYDQYLIDEMAGFVYARTGNYAEAAKALEANLNSPYFDKSKAGQRLNTLVTMYYQLKNYDKAIEYGNQAIKSGAADGDTYTLVGQAYYTKGDYKGTLRFLNGYVDSLQKRGQAPKEQTLQIMLSSCMKLDDSNCTSDALERLVSRYPKPEYWQNLVSALFRSEGGNERTQLQVYRLAAKVDALRRPEDFREMAQLAIEQGSPGEAQRILEKGFAKNLFSDQRSKDQNTRLLDQAKKLAATDQSQLPKLEKDAASAGTSDKLVTLGVAYFSYQQYPKAVDAFKRALEKGGLRNEGDVRLLLGISQLMANDKDSAVQSFRQVKGDPKLARIANLWALHARQG